MVDINKKEGGSKIIKNITAAGGIVGSIAAIVALWVTVTTTIESSNNKVEENLINEIQTAAELLTKEIYTSDYKVVESLRDMMKMRLMIRNMEIQKMRAEGTAVPERYIMEQQAYTDMLEELERKWDATQ